MWKYGERLSNLYSISAEARASRRDRNTDRCGQEVPNELLSAQKNLAFGGSHSDYPASLRRKNGSTQIRTVWIYGDLLVRRGTLKD